MIVSHKYKFIFIKTNKTAGTSVEIALSRFCGAEDIITPLTDEDESYRSKLGYRTAQNYLLNASGSDTREFFNHIGAQQIIEYLGEKTWNDYFKFCIERNPWDRTISHYYWINKSEPRPTIADYLESEKPGLLKKYGYELYTIDGRVVVDKVYKYENLEEELREFSKTVGLPGFLELPNAKSKYRKDKRHYSDILTELEVEKIAKLFKKEIELFGYSLCLSTGLF